MARKGIIKMKIKQKESTFHPITITLETSAEAQSFFNIVDKVDDIINGFPFTTKEKIVFKQDQKELIIKLSNSLTKMLVNIG